MARKDIYEITVTNWEEHNSTIKKGHKKSLIVNNFCTDAKLRAVPVSVRWMFLGIILTCGDHTRDTVEMSGSTLRDLLESSWSIPRALDALQSLQILKWQKVALIEEKRREKKGREENSLRDSISKKPKTKAAQTKMQIPAEASPPASKENIGQKLVGVYCAAWKARYNANPPLRPQDTKNLKAVGEENGLERTTQLIEAYLAMPESWMLQKRHDLATFFSNLTAVAQFVETGETVTREKLRQVETRQNLDSMRRSIHEDGI